MKAFTYDLHLKQSATFQERLHIGLPGSTVDLLQYRARAQLRYSIDGEEILLELTTENGGIIIDAVNRVMTIIITDAQRDMLIALDEPRLVYDLFLIAPSTNSYPFLEGKVIIERSVTHD